MKNIMKIALVALTAFSFATANAGELTITGDAKASYGIQSEDAVAGKALGVANEFTLSASGELDNGFTWSYAQDIDNATVQDDGKLTLTMPGLGTVGAFISEGGLDTDNTASQSVVSRPSDTSYNEGMFDTFDLSAMNTLQYHMPADLLPFGIVGKVAYAPTTATAANSFKAAGAANTTATTASTAAFNTTAAPFGQTATMGKTATHYQVKANPYEGLNIGADYVDFNDIAFSASSGQDPESGSYYATYAYGPATIGYSKSYTAFAIASQAGDVTESVEGRKMSVSYLINDALSVSYEKETSNPDNATAATLNYELKATGVQAAYTMGGMTLAIARNTYDNARYTKDLDITDTVFTVAMAF